MVNDKSKSIITVVDDSGKKIKCDVLFSFDSDETNKSYIVYTDNTVDKNGSLKVYASIYNPKVKVSSLTPITSKKEWMIIEKLLSSLEQKKKER